MTSSARRERPLVLLVEDQSDLRRLYAEQLALSGFDVIEAGDGAEGLARATDRTPDVVLMDLSLPRMDGWEATRRLKSDERTQLATYCDEYVPDVVMLAGFLGGVVEVELGDRTDTWRVLYVDAGLQNWRLIPQDKILAWRTIDDNGVKRSVLWVDANAPTTRGGAPPRPAIQARFLRGDFVRAGDLVAPPGRGGAGGPASGLFCDAITPECCTRH